MIFPCFSDIFAILYYKRVLSSRYYTKKSISPITAEIFHCIFLWKFASGVFPLHFPFNWANLFMNFEHWAKTNLKPHLLGLSKYSECVLFYLHFGAHNLIVIDNIFASTFTQLAFAILTTNCIVIFNTATFNLISFFLRCILEKWINFECLSRTWDSRFSCIDTNRIVSLKIQKHVSRKLHVNKSNRQ